VAATVDLRVSDFVVTPSMAMDKELKRHEPSEGTTSCWKPSGVESVKLLLISDYVD
jgi:hypothetical protein